jgi:FkbM family methyltransferase
VLYDLHSSRTLNFVIGEALIGDEYGLRSIDFKEGDVFLDIGANVGSVSIMMAKKYPFLKIYSYEAHPVNYNNLVKNINENKVYNITAFNKAVSSKDDDFIEISMNLDNTGASNAYTDPKKYPDLYTEPVKVPTISLDKIIQTHAIDSLKYLKMDCEGAEFDILENSELFKTIPIESIGIEIHLFMEKLGKSRYELIKLIQQNSKNQNIKLSGL